MDSIHFRELRKKHIIKKIRKMILKLLFQYDYSQANLVMQAVEDFMKGPTWLGNQDPDELNKEINQMCEKFENTEYLFIPFDPQNLRTLQNYNPKKTKKFLQLITANGWLLPANKTVTVSVGDMPTAYFYRAKHVLRYNPFIGKGVVAKKDYNQFL